MKKRIRILVADRNPNVRDFLKRELAVEGYRVNLAGNGQEVFNCIKGPKGIDLLILDLDLPHAGDRNILDEIRCSMPSLPVIVHTYLPQYTNQPGTLNNTTLVEKNGNSIDLLKDVISEVLNHPVSYMVNGV